jgi:hypothetical protein
MSEKAKPPSIGRRPILRTPRGGFHKVKVAYDRKLMKRELDETQITQESLGDPT